MLKGRAALGLWLLFIAACAAVVTQARFSADMSAFLPGAATPLERLLAAQLREGIAARLILIGIDDAPPDRLAPLSRAFAHRLDGRAEFAYVANGDTRRMLADRDFLLAHRYVLSPAVAPGRFERAALAAALERAYEALASPAGAIVRRYLPADPTGELAQLAGMLAGDARPAMRDGVWVTADGDTALLLVQTAAPGADIDAQERNIALIEQAWAAARAEAGVDGAALRLTGPAVFAVRARDAMRADVHRLSLAATVLIALLLAAAFRSPRLIAVAFVPVVTGALAGVAAVAAWFGTVHVITLGFGVTLIGEAVDYAIYLFVQRRPAETPAQSLARIWPTLRLGVAVSVASFCAMLFAGFPGLAQLGLFSAVGLLAALATTRGVLPHLVGSAAPTAFARGLARIVPRWRRPLRVRLAAISVVLLAACVGVWVQRPIWDDDLARINPVSDADRALEERLRTGLGAPEGRWLLVVSGPSSEHALERAEALAAPLDGLVAKGALRGFDSPARYLPSRAAQAARRAALPDEAQLSATMNAVVAASPFRAEMFAPFIRDVAAAKAAPPLERASLRGTAFALKVDALLVEQDGFWHALLPLRGVADAGALAVLAGDGVALLDVRQAAATLFATYRQHALALWAVGLAIIAVLLYLQLHSIARTVAVLAPLAAAIGVTCAILLAGGAKLTLFHLVALLLVAGLGSNYALFFERPETAPGERDATAAAVILCAAATLVPFGLLALSQTPVLVMMGTTVVLGAAASLILAALIGPVHTPGRD